MPATDDTTSPCFIGLSHASLLALWEGETVSVDGLMLDMTLDAIAAAPNDQFAQTPDETTDTLHLSRQTVTSLLDCFGVKHKIPLLWPPTRYGRSFNLQMTGTDVIDTDYDPSNE